MSQAFQEASQANTTVQVLKKISERNPKRCNRSKGTDTEGGVAIGESKSDVKLGKFAAAEEAIMVDQLGVVLDGALFRPAIGGRGDSGVGVGLLLDALVHSEGEDAAVATAPAEGEEEEEDCAKTEHFLRYPSTMLKQTPKRKIFSIEETKMTKSGGSRVGFGFGVSQ
ncbi:hypothetical protein SESBI_37280 [Sesbania bispinosa]|nr:hypothetical protein SESBI_37280 [Sesbania bispinosa]